MDKMPAYRWRDAHRLAAWLRRAGSEIAETLEPKMTVVLKDGEELPDLAHLLDVLGRMVVAEQANLDKRDSEKRRHSSEVAVARFTLRREVMPLLRSRVQEVRQWMRGQLSPEKIKNLLGFKGRTPRSDEGLVDLATVVVRRLSELEPILTPSGPIDPSGWAEYLRQPLQRANGLLRTIEDRGEDRSVSAEKKAEAMKTYDTLFRRVARVGWIFCHLGGIEKVARKLVTKGGRPGVKTKKPRGPVNIV